MRVQRLLLGGSRVRFLGEVGFVFEGNGPGVAQVEVRWYGSSVPYNAVDCC